MLKKEERASLLTEAWKKTVEVQQHFNDIELRIRNYALTLLLAVVGAAGVAHKEGILFSIGGTSFPLSSCLLSAGLVAFGAFFFMDKYWYHRLLSVTEQFIYGAIEQAIYRTDLGCKKPDTI